MSVNQLRQLQNDRAESRFFDIVETFRANSLKELGWDLESLKHQFSVKRVICSVRYEKLINRNCQLTLFLNVDLRGALVAKCNFRHAVIKDTSFAGAKLEDIDAESLKVITAGFELAVCARVTLKNAVIDDAVFIGVDFRGCDLSNATISNSCFFGANLSGCKLVGTSFEKCDLTFADLRNADLSSSRMTNSNLSFVKATGSELGAGVEYENVNFFKTEFDNDETLPKYDRYDEKQCRQKLERLSILREKMKQLTEPDRLWLQKLHQERQSSLPGSPGS
jgi:uncharacterized protein YjbI with pentapeptide repeats